MPVSHRSRSSTFFARFEVFGVGVDGAVSAASLRFRRLGVLGTGRVVVVVFDGTLRFAGLESSVIGERLGALLESSLRFIGAIKMNVGYWVVYPSVS